MPCSDGGVPYRDDSERERADMLARIACAALTELERIGQEDFLLLQNDEVREWWAEHKEFDRVRKEHERIREEANRKRQEALDKLSPEDKKILGIE